MEKFMENFTGIKKDVYAFIITIFALCGLFLFMKKSKHFCPDSLAFTFMYLAAPLFLLFKWIFDIAFSENNSPSI